MDPYARAVIYGLRAIAVLAVLGAIWWGWDKMVSTIRAPVVAQVNVLADANKSLKADNTRIELERDALAEALANRATRETGIDKGVADKHQHDEAAKNASPGVKAWWDTPIPAELFQ